MSGGTSMITRWKAVDRLHRRIEGAVERRLHEDLGLSFREFQSLEVLRHSVAAGPLHLQNLAAEIVLSQSATSRLVTRLQNRGLITTAPANRDRRSVDVQLTPLALEVLRRGTPLVAAAVRDAVEALAAEGDASTVLRYLQGSSPDGALPRELLTTAEL